MGDAQLKLHGGNAIGFMTLEGTKAAGTDLHSKTASILGISRNNAKIFNYGRIYGAGIKFATSLLKQFNPNLSDSQAEQTANNLYNATKGQKYTRKNNRLIDKPFWFGGTESLVFNRLEDFAEQEQPRTPVLGAGLTQALWREHLSKGGFLTSRINWAIQSSGVDYLHLLITSMDYLIRLYDLDCRLAITVHDEIRYLVKAEDRYRAAMALQVANLWTRAMFCHQMGISDVPQSCAFFSAVDIDNVLRKEVDMDCVTPSHPEKLAPGESLDILQLLEKGDEARLDMGLDEIEKKIPLSYTYTESVPVMQQLAERGGSLDDQLFSLEAQLATKISDVNDIVNKWKKKLLPPKTSSEKQTGERAKPVDSNEYNYEASFDEAAYEEYQNRHSAIPASPNKADFPKTLPRGKPSLNRSGILRNQKKTASAPVAVTVS